MAEPRERPILFSASMVRALLDGSKTQTRRLVKWNNHAGVNLNFSGLTLDSSAPGCFELYTRDGDARWQERAKAVCPYGKPGDRLWVKETFIPWRYTSFESTEYDTLTRDVTGVSLSQWVEEHGHHDVRVCYAADGPEDGPWMPSIYMPRWASRITLEITDVRVQRLQDISEEDAIAEGIERVGGGRYWRSYVGGGAFGPAKASFASLWDSISGEGAWGANPWVWALTFRVLTPAVTERKVA